MLLLRSARVISPPDGLDTVCDLRVTDGRVAELGVDLSASDARVIDCRGRAVLPAFVDLVAELPDPGMSWREDLRSGSLSAAAGGFATVLVSPVNDPVLDQGALAQGLVLRGQGAPGARLLMAGALTMGLDGAELAEIGSMLDEGCVAISDGGRATKDLSILRNALEYTRPFGAPVLLRPGIPSLESRGCMHEGAISMQIGLRGIPAASEEVGLAAIIALLRLTGGRVHITHLSTERSVSLLSQARAEGLSISASVAARSLMLTDEQVSISGYSSATRLLPPLRPESDRRALCRALADGLLDCVSSDHQPWTRVEKEVEFERCDPGAVGFESAFAATLTALDGDLPLVARVLACQPARVIGREACIRVGAPADLVVVDPNVQRPVGPPRLSRGVNEPLQGLNLRGRVELTLVDGVVRHSLTDRPSTR